MLDKNDFYGPYVMIHKLWSITADSAEHGSHSFNDCVCSSSGFYHFESEAVCELLESNPPPSLSELRIPKELINSYQLFVTSGTFADDTVTNGTVTEYEEDEEDGFQANSRYCVGTICCYGDLQINRSLKKSSMHQNINLGSGLFRQFGQVKFPM